MNRNRVSCAVAGLAIATVGALAPVLATPASANTTQKRVVIRAADADGVGYSGGTASAHVSADGNWLGFSRLTANGSFLKSLVSGTTTLISLNDADQPANAPSTVEGLNDDGVLILFSTTATNMGQGPATARDLYVRNRDTGHTERVNLLPTSGNPVAVKPGESTLSDSGQYVAFATTTFHVYARNRYISQTEQVDVTSGEAQGNGSSLEPSISANGRYVTFTSHSSDLVPGDANFVSDIFERDRVAGTTIRVSLSDTEVASNLGSDHSSVSDDGQAVAFASDATNLVVGDTNTDQDVFVRYLTSQATYRTSLPTGGAQASGVSGRPDISGPGNMVAFESTANLDVTSTNPHGAVYLRDIGGNLTTLQGRTGSAGPDLAASGASISSATTAVAFTSAATNHVAGDTNGATDAFVERWEPLGPFAQIESLVPSITAAFGITPGADAAKIDAIHDGRLTTAHLIVASAHTPAWAQHREPVARLYQAFFHRQPDLGGLNYWVKKRSGGTKLGVIAAYFASSSEFKTAYGSVGNSDFVTLVYANVLQRKPDAAGLNHWVAKMAGGMSRGDVMVAFSESSEGKRFLAPEVDSTLMGLAMLGKMPSKALWQQAANSHRDHVMAEWGALTYLNSVEYVALIAP